MSGELELVQRRLADALTSADPVAELERAALDAALSDAARRALANAAADGVRISALLVIRLRFEHALQGSRVAAQWFESDPRAFTAAFRRYHAEVAPAFVLAADEGRAFDRWLERRALV